ncbi:MAG: hypothetical protein LLF83_08635 [Methanobacterium sp.]|nr:hypothetical protein [Methanobacterium sp.]
MRRSQQLLIFIGLMGIIVVIYYLITPLFIGSESFNGFSNEANDTIIISYSTGDMKGLEVGVASYAGREGIPLILSSKTIPYPLNQWLPLFKDQANIKKAIVVGPVSPGQIYFLKLQNLKIEQINGGSKARILTEIAEKTYQSQDTVIITPADPSASLLGSVMNIPVFVVAEPGKYTSSNTLPPEYSAYLSKFNIKKVIIVGGVSSNIIDDLKAKNLTIENLSGNDSFETSEIVSERIIDIQKQKGVNINSAYCGFYGELPAIIPLAYRNNSIIIQDPTLHMDETVDFIKSKGINIAILTRNGPADYLQMEEPDFVSERFNSKLGANNITTYSLTNFRTVNEATGLYETKILTAESLLGTGNTWGKKWFGEGLNLTDVDMNQILTEYSPYPPLLDVIIRNVNWYTSSGSQLSVTKIGLNTWYSHWEGIHPYIWHRYNEREWYCYSGSQYSWHWIHANQTDNGTYYTSENDTWTVEYLSDNKVYYRVYWIKKGNMWEEIHTEASFKWNYLFNSWICTQEGTDQYFIIYSQLTPGI